MEAQIRPATKSDIPKIVQFNAAMALETEGVSLDMHKLKAGVRAIFDDQQKGFYLVAELSGEVRASLMITYEWSDWRNGFFWWIQSVYVEPHYRKKGLYRLMYEHLQETINKDKDIVGLRLYVEKENKAAQITYSSLGMKNSDYLLYEYSKEEIAQ